MGKLLPDLPNTMIQRQARQSRGYSALEGAPDKGLSLRVLVPVAALSIAEDERLLQLLQPVPPTLARDAEAVQEVYRDYKELSLSRQGLKEIYILTLTLTLLLTLFSATALAFLLSARLSEPLALLAAGTQAVARGDYSRRAQVTSSDELGILTQSFNSMTEQLDDARSVAESHRAELETAKAYLENILANLSAGVLVLDEQLRLGTVNHGAGAILQEDVRRPEGPDPRRLAAAAAAGARHRRRLQAARHRHLAAAAGAGRAHAAGARLGSAARERRRLRGRVRRRHQAGPGAARHRLGRGGAAPGARDQEPAHADPALGRTPAGEAREQARARGRGYAQPRHRDHHQSGRGDEGHGGRFRRVRAHARAQPAAAGPERAGARSARPVRACRRAGAAHACRPDCRW